VPAADGLRVYIGRRRFSVAGDADASKRHERA